MVRLALHGGESIAFVAAHLAAHEGAKHVLARNDSLARILSGCWLSSRPAKLGGGPPGGDGQRARGRRKRGGGRRGTRRGPRP